MPVTVSIPMRIRIDVAAATSHPEWIEQAVASAVGRALEQSKRAVIDERGGYFGVSLAAPRFNWSGDELDRLPPGTRRALEGQVTRIIAEAAERSGIFDAAREAEQAGAPLSKPAVERFDRHRFSSLFGTYDVPSYDGGRRAIVTLGEPEFVTGPPPVVHRWRPMTEAALQRSLRETIAEVVRQWGTLPAGVSQGLLLRRSTQSGLDWFVLIFSRPLTVFSFDAFGEYRYRGANQHPPFEIVHVEPPPARASAERRVLTGGAESLEAAISELMGPEIAARIQEVRPRGETETVAEYDEIIAQATDREVARRTSELLSSLGEGGSIASLVHVRMGRYYLLIPVTASQDATLHWTGTANLLPVTLETAEPSGASGDEAAGGEEGRGAEGRGAGGGGEGEGTGGEGGSGVGGGTGDGRDGGGRARPRGFVFDPSTPPGDEAGSLFPEMPGGDVTPTCSPFEGEPSIEELGEDGASLWRAIEDIAYRLQIQPCKFAAHFCVSAANVIGGRAGDISARIGQLEPSGFTRPVPEEGGNMGLVQFHPVASPSIQFLRHLSGVVPRLAALMRRILRVYEKPEHRVKIRGTWEGDVVAWQLHFLEAFSPAMKSAVGDVFVTTCQAMLMQLLQASKQAIDQRLERFEAYAPIFERLLVSQLTEYAELDGLRERLRRHEMAQTVHSITDSMGGDAAAAIAATNPATQWFAAARALSGAIVQADSGAQAAGRANEVVRGEDGVARIRDSHGVLWSMQDLEQAMVMQRGLAEGVDPLVKQISKLPNLMARFRENRNAIRDELRRVLNEMRANNEEMLGKTRADPRFAFRASTIQEHIPSATVPGTRFALQGIHLRAHEQIGEFFLGDSYYAGGIDYLFSAEAGREALINAGLMFEIIVLSIACPPAGFLLGVAVSAADVIHAHERERLFESLIDPELVLTRAEVELELFAAYLGLAFSLVPEAGTAVGAVGRGTRIAVRSTVRTTLRQGLRAGLRTGVRTGLRRGARAASRYVVRRVTRQIIEAASRDFLETFVREVVTNVVMDRLIEKVMEPILAYVEREAQIRESVGGPEGARLILAILESGDGSGRTMGRHGGAR